MMTRFLEIIFEKGSFVWFSEIPFVDKSKSMRAYYSGQRSKFPLGSRTRSSRKELI